MRNLTLALAMAFGSVALAQQPYWVYVFGTVSGCTPGQVITISTSVETVTTTVTPTCFYFATVTAGDNPSAVTASTPCQGAIQTASGTVTFNSFLDSAYIQLDLNCGANSNPDCTGIENGPNMPGTPCSDNNPLTYNDTWSANCACIGVDTSYVDCNGVQNGPALPGTACDDGNPLTFGDAWTGNCVCMGVDSSYFDCWGLMGGGNLPGTACWIPGTNYIGTWDANCN
ncbi:MAG TPA: hypothetical protein PK760_09465, partial [Flavobacteriales bacterium]|nr:hypothetical protein [Flavobacteriales bacterium]